MQGAGLPDLAWYKYSHLLPTHLLPLRYLTAEAAQPLAMHSLQLHLLPLDSSKPRCPQSICGDHCGKYGVEGLAVLLFHGIATSQQALCKLLSKRNLGSLNMYLWVGQHHAPNNTFQGRQWGWSSLTTLSKYPPHLPHMGKSEGCQLPVCSRGWGDWLDAG